jgi:hypothetical protein
MNVAVERNEAWKVFMRTFSLHLNLLAGYLRLDLEEIWGTGGTLAPHGHSMMAHSLIPNSGTTLGTQDLIEVRAFHQERVSQCS